MTGFTVVTTVATEIPGEANKADLLNDVWVWHDYLAKKYSGHTTGTPNWWDDKTPRFDAWAAASCRVWKIDPNDKALPSQLMVDQRPPFKTYTDRRHLDVWQVLKSTDNGGLPTWFVVYKESSSVWWVCMADETMEKAYA